MAVAISRRRFTIEDYHRMAEAGIFTEDDRLELIDGEIFEMSPIGKYHAACVKRLNALLTETLGRRVIVSAQDPIQLSDDSEPVPDLALLTFRPDYYAASLPRPSDTLLIIEVADTSLIFDREVKLPRYARASIPEVWIVNLRDGIIEVYSAPSTDGYTQSKQALHGDSLALPAPLDAQIAVSDILG
jgi:Uma2 family endonuclease